MKYNSKVINLNTQVKLLYSVVWKILLCTVLLLDNLTVYKKFEEIDEKDNW